MIFYAPQPHSAVMPVATAFAEHAISSRTFEAKSAGGMPLVERLIVADAGNSLELHNEQDTREEFDWSNARTQREFIRLEQKVLARKGAPDDQQRYNAMKRDRNSRIFADRYLHDYAEIQRIRKLSEKLAEIQQYLRPVRL